MKIKFAVTQRDIDKGTTCSSMTCPIALALNRKLQQNGLFTTMDVSIGKNRVLAFLAGQVHRAELPSEAKSFIEVFDNGGTPLPFELELDFSPLNDVSFS